jgi:hypothetical protein
MLRNFPTLTNLSIALFCLIFIYILSIKQESTTIKNFSKNTNYKLKITLYYNGSNDVNLTFVDGIWKQLIFKYNKSPLIYFSQQNIHKNKYFNNYTFESTPSIFISIDEHNLIYKYNGPLTFSDIEHFIMLIGASVQ